MSDDGLKIPHKNFSLDIIQLQLNTVMFLDRSSQCARFCDSSVGNTPEGFPERVFQCLSIAFSEQELKQYTWHDNLALVRESVRQQGNKYDCALYVLTHAILANAEIDSKTDVRFSFESMLQLRQDLMNRFLEDRPWSDCEVRELRIRDPDYQAPVHEVEEVSDDEVQIIEPDDSVEPRARERLEPRAIIQKPRAREGLEPRGIIQEPRAREGLEPRGIIQEPKSREGLEPRAKLQEPARELPPKAIIQKPARELPPRIITQKPARELPMQHKIDWKSVSNMKKARRHFKNIQEMETELNKRPKIMKELLQRSYLPSADPGRFHFGPSWYRLKIIKFVKQHETRKKNKKNNEKRRKNAKSKK